MTLTALVRLNIRTLTPYQSARRIGGKGDVWLNANECPQAQAITLMLEQLNRYPECQPSKVIDAYAKYANVDNNQVIMTRGADEGIELLMRAFCQPDNINDTVVYCPPTYGMYAVSANTLDIPIKTVALTNDWQLDLDALYKVLPQSKIIYLCSPNNPTGNLLNLDDITTLLDKCINSQIIVVDEAYIEFCPQATVVSLLKQYPNLVILRTLSKAFALAGIRCGFILANSEVIEILSKVIAPYPIPTPVALIAEQALSVSGIEQMKNNVNFVLEERALMIHTLQQYACIEKVYPSESNYILIKERNNADIFKKLWEQGIILRDQNQQVNLTRCIRITIGTQQENLTVINAIKKIN